MTFEDMLQDLVNQDDEFKVQLAAICSIEDKISSGEYAFLKDLVK